MRYSRYIRYYTIYRYIYIAYEYMLYAFHKPLESLRASQNRCPALSPRSSDFSSSRLSCIFCR